MLSGQEGLLGFDDVCSGIKILKNTSKGYHDLCLANQVPSIRKFSGKSYQAVK